MKRQVKNILRIFIVFIMVTLPLFYGCKGSDTREKVDDTVKTLAGKKDVDQMKKMKKNIGKIEDKQKERMDELDKTTSEEDQ